MKPFSIILILVFLLLSGLHIFWSLGGQWGMGVTLPTNLEGVKILNPRKIDSAIVGIGLLLIATFYFVNAGFLTFQLPSLLRKIALWSIPIIFALRAMGDFKYVGFFKSITSTEFARLDTLLYTPLCLGIAITGFLILRLSLSE